MLRCGQLQWNNLDGIDASTGNYLDISSGRICYPLDFRKSTPASSASLIRRILLIESALLLGGDDQY
jgi:hypothetical protein